GLPHAVSARPQYAIAHAGSALSVSLNPSAAWENSNEWSRATARMKAGRAAALHEFAKRIVPSFPAGGWSCPCDATTGATIATTKTADRSIVGLLHIVGTRARYFLTCRSSICRRTTAP